MEKGRWGGAAFPRRPVTMSPGNNAIFVTPPLRVDLYHGEARRAREREQHTEKELGPTKPTNRQPWCWAIEWHPGWVLGVASNG